MLDEIDLVRLHFTEESLDLLNVCLGFIMYGVALQLRWEDFVEVGKHPKAVIVGLFSQFILLPALTFILIYFYQPRASLALGMILVAACPGGNISNFFSQMSRGNVALSVSLTAFSTLLCLIMTPVNVSFWGSLLPDTAAILRDVELNFWKMTRAVLLLLGIPLIAGVLTTKYLPKISLAIQKPIRLASIVFFVLFVVVAFYNNFDFFLQYIGMVILVVFLHNLLALLGGYSLSSLLGLKPEDRRAITIETGIQNSGLGLILIFNFFDGLGGMAMVAAWWGIWHIIAGLSLGSWWGRRIPSA